jgi:hypothetical protein
MLRYETTRELKILAYSFFTKKNKDIIKNRKLIIVLLQQIRLIQQFHIPKMNEFISIEFFQIIYFSSPCTEH